MVAWVTGGSRNPCTDVREYPSKIDPREAYGGHKVSEKKFRPARNLFDSLIPAPLYDTLVEDSIFKAPNNETSTPVAPNPVSEKFPLLPMEKSSKGPMLSPDQVWNRIAEKFTETLRFFTEREADLESGNNCKSAISLMSVTIRKPFTPIKSIALLYSYLPFVLVALMVVVDITTIAPLSLYATIMLGSMALVNEYYGKKLYQQPRPPLSMVNSSGMPSSHCVTSYGALTWIILEALSNASPNAMRYVGAALSVCALAPVPWARWRLDDHTTGQCAVGCAVGFILGVILYSVRVSVLPSHPMF